MIASDGQLIVGYFYNGSSRGRPIKIVYPNPVFSVTLTESDVVFLAFRSGLLYTFDIDAIPIASIELKTAIDGVNGTFLPYIAPAVGGPAGETFYILTLFESEEKMLSEAPRHVHRLYAINMTHLMAPRMNVTWYYEFESHEDVVKDPILLYVDEKLFFRAFDGAQSTLYAVAENGYSGKKIWEATFDHPIQTVSYFKSLSSSSQGMLYVSLNDAGDTALLIVDPVNAAVKGTIFLSRLFGFDSLLVTSDIMIASDEKNPSKSPHIFFGYQAGEDLFGVAGVAVPSSSNPQANWNVSSPDGNAVTGQLANFDSDIGKPSRQIVCTTRKTIFSIRLVGKS